MFLPCCLTFSFCYCSILTLLPDIDSIARDFPAVVARHFPSAICCVSKLPLIGGLRHLELQFSFCDLELLDWSCDFHFVTWSHQIGVAISYLILLEKFTSISLLSRFTFSLVFYGYFRLHHNVIVI